MKDSKKTIFMVVGHHGSGKTTVVGHYPHMPLDMFVSEVNGLLSLGGRQGLDRLSSFKKDYIFRKIASLKGRNLILHGLYYISKKDVERYTKSHRLVIIYVQVSFESIRKRIRLRSGMHASQTTWMTNERKMKSFMDVAKEADCPVYIVDGELQEQELGEAVWRIISSLIRKYEGV